MLIPRKFLEVKFRIFSAIMKADADIKGYLTFVNNLLFLASLTLITSLSISLNAIPYLSNLVTDVLQIRSANHRSIEKSGIKVDLTDTCY